MGGNNISAKRNSRLFLVLVIGIVAMICGSVGSMFIHLDDLGDLTINNSDNNSSYNLSANNTTNQTKYASNSSKSSSKSSYSSNSKYNNSTHK